MCVICCELLSCFRLGDLTSDVSYNYFSLPHPSIIYPPCRYVKIKNWWWWYCSLKQKMKRGFNFSCLFLTISSMALFNFEQQPKKKGSSRLNSLSYFEDLHRLMRTAIDLIRFGFPLKRSERIFRLFSRAHSGCRPRHSHESSLRMTWNYSRSSALILPHPESYFQL